jgi:hypothetical protein
VATATPVIATDFGALDDVGWVSSFNMCSLRIVSLGLFNSNVELRYVSLTAEPLYSQRSERYTKFSASSGHSWLVLQSLNVCASIIIF